VVGGKWRRGIGVVVERGEEDMRGRGVGWVE
jgi:hypothetical protein